MAYNCLKAPLQAAYAKSGDQVAKAYPTWVNYATAPYQSATHGDRYANNYANAVAKSYGKYEESGKMPVGAVLAKDSFMAHPNGKVSPGPLFIMQKMAAGFNKPSGDWRYSMIMPNGSTLGVTNGKGSANVAFCIECHASMEDQDHMFFLPEEVRH
ncbi:MAG: hypothetical protein HOE62_15785 [Alphaproteobacteria bacterium]|nr:hypothetical protein [Alphaproteobacteria bacterium]MBT4965945.1 hypothetical protein [Alphaproteobacteria bacterium]